MNATRVNSRLTAGDRWDHILARWGINRNGHRVQPGLYAMGNATPDAPVFVTANYTLSFDALRTSLEGIDCYILVLDTLGVNVWCAAGKGSFGTAEIVRRIETAGLSGVVSHRRLIVPQLGAAGVSAHEVKRRTGFTVEYGPVRARDIRAYLSEGMATPEMRRVRFDLVDRLVVVPVDMVRALLPMGLAALALYFAGGVWVSLGVISSVLAGTLLFPSFLPWIPTRDFSSKGFLTGGLAILPVALLSILLNNDPLWRQLAGTASYLLVFPAVSAFLALNFTGSTTFTSKSGVRREMYGYIPVIAGMFACGIILAIAIWLTRAFGGA